MNLEGKFGQVSFPTPNNSLVPKHRVNELASDTGGNQYQVHGLTYITGVPSQPKHNDLLSRKTYEE